MCASMIFPFNATAATLTGRRAKKPGREVSRNTVWGSCKLFVFSGIFQEHYEEPEWLLLQLYPVPVFQEFAGGGIHLERSKAKERTERRLHHRPHRWPTWRMATRCAWLDG